MGELHERLTPIGTDAQPLNSTGRADALALATELLGQVAVRAPEKVVRLGGGAPCPPTPPRLTRSRAHPSRCGGDARCDTWQHEVELSLDDNAVVDSVYALLDLAPADARPGVNETLLEAAYEWRRQKVTPYLLLLSCYLLLKSVLLTPHTLRSRKQRSPSFESL